MVVDLQELPLYVAQSNVISSLNVKIQLDLEKWWLNQDRTFSFYSIDFGSKWSRAGFALYHKFLMTLVSLNIHPEVWSCVTFSHPILENRKEAMMGGRDRWYRPTVTGIFKEEATGQLHTPAPCWPESNNKRCWKV